MAEIISSSIIDNLIGPKMSHDTAIELVEKLQSLYDQPDRYYHNFKHILQVMSFLEDNIDLIDNPRIAFWAALYHDIIYDTHSGFGKNEDESAKFAVAELSGKLPDEELRQISLFIKATTSHDVNTTNNGLRLFLDADISILGAQPEEYSEYATNIRKEYGWATEEQYSNARIEILRSFLNRERIYTTNIAHSSLEAQARININNEIEQLLKH